MRKIFTLALAIIIFAIVHEGLHALAASFYGEYEAFHIRPYGLEVTVKTPAGERQGLQWAIISGLPNGVTILAGYLLFAGRRYFASQSLLILRNLGYWCTLLFMLCDPFNLSIVPLIFGGDVNGISVGLGLPVIIIQVFGLALLLANREIVAQFLLPAFGIVTDHPFFKPFIRLHRSSLRPQEPGV